MINTITITNTFTIINTITQAVEVVASLKLKGKLKKCDKEIRSRLSNNAFVRSHSGVFEEQTSNNVNVASWNPDNLLCVVDNDNFEINPPLYSELALDERENEYTNTNTNTNINTTTTTNATIIIIIV
eukprot:Pgem_evm1s18967